MAMPPPYQELPPPPTAANEGTTKRQQVVSQIQNQLTELVAENERLEDQLQKQHDDLVAERETLRHGLSKQHTNLVTENQTLRNRLQKQHDDLVTENQTLKIQLQEQHTNLITENQTLKSQLKNQDELTSKLSWLEETDEEHRRITDNFRQLAAEHHENGASWPRFYVQCFSDTLCSRLCYSWQERVIEQTWLVWADKQFALAKEAQAGKWKDKTALLAAAEATAAGLRSRVEELEKQGREREKAETQCRRAVGRLHGLLRRRRLQSRTQSRNGTGTGTQSQTQGLPQVQVQLQVQSPSTPADAKSTQPPKSSREAAPADPTDSDDEPLAKRRRTQSQTWMQTRYKTRTQTRSQNIPPPPGAISTKPPKSSTQAAAPTDPIGTDDEPLAKRRRTGVGMFHAMKRIRPVRRDAQNGEGDGEDEEDSDEDSDSDSDTDSDDSGDGDDIARYWIMPDGEYISSDTSNDAALPGQSWSLRLAELPRTLHRHAPINYDESDDEAESDGTEVESEGSEAESERGG